MVKRISVASVLVAICFLTCGCQSMRKPADCCGAGGCSAGGCSAHSLYESQQVPLGQYQPPIASQVTETANANSFPGVSQRNAVPRGIDGSPAFGAGPGGSSIIPR